jgi:hypothetical protein
MSFQFGNKVSLVWKKLKKGDYTVKPFEVYKKWEITTESSSLNYYQNFDIDVYRVLYPENHLYFGNVANISSSLYTRVFTTQSIDPKMLWYYADHTFYTDHVKHKDPTLLTEFNRELYLGESSSMFSIPQGVFGEGIRRGTFKFHHFNTSTASLNYDIADNSNGDIIDKSFDVTKFVDTRYLLLNVGFNEKYREYNFRNKLVNYVLDNSNYGNNIQIINPKQITYLSGIPTTDTSQSSGVSVSLSGGYFDVKNSANFNFIYKQDFAFSFWINVPPTQSNESLTYNCLFNKRTSIDGDTRYVLKTGRSTGNKYEENQSSQYPFDIKIDNRTSATPNIIRFGQSSGIRVQEVTSSQLTTGIWHHVVCQKTSSKFEIWIDGTLNTSVSSSIFSNVTNENNFFIGGNGTDYAIFSGSLDEVRIYNKGLTSTEISYLGNNSFANGYAYQTDRIGNIFYKSGIALISDPRPKYANAFLGRTGSYDYSNLDYGFTGSFRSTTTFYEHEITCKIRKSEFNFTTNSSVYKDKNPNAIRVEDYVTSSLFNPYITTIGLYNEKRDLVAVAKLSSPLEKRDDVDMNVVIRFDV